MGRKPKPVEEAVLYERLVEAAQSIDADFKAKSKKEDDQAYMQRLVDCINSIDENAWPNLDEDIQTWFNASVASSDAGEAIEYPEGYHPTEVAAEPVEVSTPRKVMVKKLAAPARKQAAAEADDEDKTAVASRNNGSTQSEPLPAHIASVAQSLGIDPHAAAALIEAAALAGKKPKEPKIGAVGLIQQYMVQNPNATKEQVKKHLAKYNRDDVADSTIAVTRGGTLAVLRFAREAGLITQ